MTTRKPRVKKPPAEIVGSFAEVMKRGECNDGRDLYAFYYVVGKTFAGIDNPKEMYVLAASELQAWKAMHSSIGVMEKLTKGKMSDRYKREALRLMEGQSNGETQESQESDSGEL